MVTYPHVSEETAVQGGRPCIEGTEIRVTAVAAALDNGNSVAALQEYFGTRLTLAQVYSALAFYHDNVDALGRARAEDERADAEAERERLAAIKRKYMGL